MQKFVGISASMLVETEGMTIGNRLSCVGYNFTDALLAAGAVPIILPINTDEQVVKAQLSRVDALILSGGHDLNPLRYGEEPHKLLGETFDERDTFDFLLIAEALRRKMPVLGICRGMQILNVFCGGTLYQDNSLAPTYYVKHVQGHSPSYRSHTVNFSAGSQLAAIFGAKTLVNSFHHMSVAKAAPDFKVTAHAADQIVEAIERQEGSFAMGVQWHPELLWQDEQMLEIFRLLISKS